MKKKIKILNQISNLRQEYEDLISKEIRTAYDEFRSNNKKEIEKILAKDYIPLFFLEQAFIKWVVLNKPEYYTRSLRAFTFFDVITYGYNNYENNYYSLSTHWCNNENCSKNMAHQLPYHIGMTGLEFSIFTISDFPELIPYALFDPSKFIQLDFEDVGEKNCFIYKTKRGCALNSYRTWKFFETPFESLEGTDEEIRLMLIRELDSEK